MFLKNFWKRLYYIYLGSVMLSRWAVGLMLLASIVGGGVGFAASGGLLLGFLYGVSASSFFCLILLFVIACLMAAFDDVQVVTEVQEEDGHYVMKGVTNKNGKVVMVVPSHLWQSPIHENPDE